MRPIHSNNNWEDAYPARSRASHKVSMKRNLYPPSLKRSRPPPPASFHREGAGRDGFRYRDYDGIR